MPPTHLGGDVTGMHPRASRTLRDLATLYGCTVGQIKERLDGKVEPCGREKIVTTRSAALYDLDEVTEALGEPPA